MTTEERGAGSAGAAGSASSAGAAGSASSAEARGFLRQRLAGFALSTAAFAGFFLVFRLVAELIHPTPEALAYLIPQAATPAVFLGLWWIARRARRQQTLVAADAGAMILGATSLGLTMLSIPHPVRPDLFLVYALGAMLVLHAIWVPTTPRTTLAIGVAIGVPALGLCGYLHQTGFSPAIYSAAAPAFLRQPGPFFAVNLLIADTVWLIAMIALATASTRVVHGLRAEVRDARRLGQYTLGARLGAGGMGEVYRASHAMLRRPTAIKLLPPDKLGEASVARFEREVQLTARLTHPNTIRIYDYGRTPDGVFYYAMELLGGADLARLVATTGPMPAARVIRILAQAAGALAEAHGIGLIHRDIKPANILLTEQGGELDVAKLLDFGLVKDVAVADGVTQDSAMAGTPQYMAPEAFSAPDRVDQRADLYALGAVGYFLLTGKDVFEGRTVVEIAGHHLHTTPIAPSVRAGLALPADLEALLLACLAKAPANRPDSARTLGRQLAACADAGGWTDDDARGFWARHGGALGAGEAGGDDGVGGGATALAIDLASRQHGHADTALAAAPTLASADTMQIDAARR